MTSASNSSSFCSNLRALPPLDRQQLQWPNHVHAILYGPSFLHQRFEAFLCRNSLSALYSFGNHSGVRHGTSRATAVIENRALLCNAGKEQLHLRSTHRSLANRPCNPHEDEATNTIVQASFANGAQMLGIFNSGTLQDSTDPAKMLGKLRNFLNSLSGFTHAVVMAPHPACFFPSTRADEKCFVNMSDPSLNRFSDGCMSVTTGRCSLSEIHTAGPGCGFLDWRRKQCLLENGHPKTRQ